MYPDIPPRPLRSILADLEGRQARFLSHGIDDPGTTKSIARVKARIEAERQATAKTTANQS